ncbi:hypothetical protein H8K90_12680 [Winogradskyella echinorum]|uniref:7-cyano-7-deazaguanine synthase n=1 Tax=Winogradskyella echinorum TaxID=538189 RepID=A0ABR6Y3K5_9FLAO|nr:hypothetical protein [Winogradskyella echinorum]MBC3847244.1 hypothetical protein [Winogradskyella echinorum]MBC5751592.1 hypothetical protein [Winogradskyella echinorum]
MGEVKHVLWTGGWDSTFRVIELYNRGVKLQPLYVIDSSRGSTQKEIETINLLTDLIKTRFNNSNGDILPVELIERKDIRSNLYIKLMYKLIKRRRKIGTQYKWLGYLSKKYEWLEIGFHKKDRDRLINPNQLIKITDDTNCENWIINRRKTSFPIGQLFKNFRFPLVYISKLEMKEYATEHGFLDIMLSTWFCHRSEEKPCGDCAPCKQYVINDFGFRLE